jgi:hypothetical protein
MSGSTPPFVYNAFSDFLEAKVLGHLFLATPYVAPAAFWVALFTAGATDAGVSGTTGVEPPGASAYARQPVTWVAAPAQDDGSSAVWNNAVLQWQPATTGWGTLTGLGVFDAVTAGNLLAYAPLVIPKFVSYGDAVRFPVNTLMIGLQ